MQRKFFLLFFLLFGFFNLLSAQTSVSTLSSFFEDFTMNENGNDAEWTFYLDTENKIYYIDFEAINVNLNDIKVINEVGDVVLNDNLWNLPVNTIYELNMKNFKPGNYKVQLRTYTGLIQKEISVSE